MSAAAEKKAREIENALLLGGYQEFSAPDEEGIRHRREPLKHLVWLIVDSTVLDQAGFEMQHGRNSNRYLRVWWKAVVPNR